MELGIREANFVSVDSDLNSTFNSINYESHEVLTQTIGLTLPCVIVLVIASLVGTFGNVLILLSVISRKNLHDVESIFIVNLAASDLYVTSVADPMSIIAKLEGEAFFDRIPGLCQTVASICTISCVTSLMTIAMMSINRYFYICAHEKYSVIFKKWNCICICISLYFVGGILVLLNAASIGDHGFDRKSLECIWDRMATFPYTVVFSVVLVWIPSIVTGVCYLRIFMYVREHRRRVRERTAPGGPSPFLKKIHLARTLFIIYAVFLTCWAPYALLIVIDSKDTFPHELHVYITMFAHLHPSVNWLVYYLTNKKFAEAYKALLSKCRLCHFKTTDSSSTVLIPETLGSCSKYRHSYSLRECCDVTYDAYGSEVCLASNKLHTCNIGDTRSFQHSQQTIPDVDC